MTIYYALIAKRNNIILSEYTEYSGNFQQYTMQLMQRVEPETKKTFELLYQQRSQIQLMQYGLTVLCMTDKAIQKKIAFAFMQDVRKTIVATYTARELENAKAYSLTTFTDKLREKLTYYNSNPITINDKTDELVKELHGLKDTMVENLDRLIQRDGKIEVIAQKAESLSTYSKTYRQRARKLRVQQRNRRIFYIVMLILIIGIVAYVIAGMACGFTFQSSSKPIPPKSKKIMETFSEIPVINLNAYLNKENDDWKEECDKVAKSLYEFGILIIKDPRVNYQDNDDYLDLMEQYFERTSKQFYEGKTLEDCKPEINFQAGVTPEKQERPRNHQQIEKLLTQENKPRSKFPPELDAKWRFFWAIGERPKEVQDNIPRIIPSGFPDWEEKMNKWGNMMLDACLTIGEMAAIGMGLKPDTFSSKMLGGPHLLAPTGSDLTKYGLGTSLAGFHYDLNFLTIHGRSRFPGLYIWLRNLKKILVKVPQGCLLLQAGSMFEHITGGYVMAGYHEVILTEETIAAVDKAKEEIANGNPRILWRVSSTLFSHIRYDVDLSPLPEMQHLYNSEEAKSKYKKMTAHDKLMEELRAINLAPRLEQETESINE